MGWMLGSLMALATVSVQARSYRIEKDYSIIEFRIRHLVSMTEGHFTDFDGTLDYDPAKPEDAKVDVTVRPASVDTRNKRRDKHLRNEDFFYVSKYPIARYVSQSVKRLGLDRLQVEGFLTLRGVTLPVSLEVTLRGATRDDFGRGHAGFSATARINRKDFGITWNETLDNGGFLLGDEVSLEIEMDAVEQPATGRPSP